MAFLYNEIAVGATAYPAGPQISTIPVSASGAANPNNLFQGWTPEFHTYRVVAGSSGGDVFVSFDGVKDAQRIPFGPDSAGGLILPFTLPVYYRQVWLRAALGGATATVGCGLFTKQ